MAVLDDDWAVSGDSFGPRRERAFAAAFRRAIAAAKLLNDAGLIAIYACSAPTIEGRRRARQALEPSRLLEIHLAESPAGLRRRDEMPAYEPPSCPDLILPTHLWRVSSCVDAILKHLQKHRVLR